MAIGWFVSRKENLEGFLVNNRRTPSWFLVFTVVSTNVGAGTLVAMTAEAYETGISWPLLSALVVIPAFFFVAFFGPRMKRFGDRFKAHTLGDFFGLRYSQANRILVGLILISSYFFFAAMQFVGVAALTTVMTGLSFNISLIISSIIVIIYTTMSGVKGDFYTDAAQFWVMSIVLFAVLVPLSWIAVGGSATLAALPPKYFDPFAFGGPIFFISALIFGLPLGVISMEIWQRAYAASSPKSARKVLAASGLVNLPFLILPALLGMSAAVLIPGIDKNMALFALMNHILPSGILGFGLAGILAALMSTVDSMILVGSATLLKDFYKSFINKKAQEKKLLKMGRLFTFLYGGAALIAAYTIADIIQILLIGVFLLLPIAPAIIGGLCWRRPTSKASFYSMLAGFLLAIVLLPLMPQLAFIPAFLVALILFVILSFLTKHAPSENTAIAEM